MNSHTLHFNFTEWIGWHSPFLLLAAETSPPPASDEAWDDEGDDDKLKDVALMGEGMDELSGLDMEIEDSPTGLDIETEDRPAYDLGPASQTLSSVGDGLCGNTTYDGVGAVGIMADGKYGKYPRFTPSTNSLFSLLNWMSIVKEKKKTNVPR